MNKYFRIKNSYQNASCVRKTEGNQYSEKLRKACFLRTANLKNALLMTLSEHQGYLCNNIKLQQKGSEDPFPGNHKIKVNPHQSSKKST